MTELLLGVVSFFLVQFIKLAAKNLGQELARYGILLVAFFVSVAIAYLQTEGVLNQEVLTQATTAFTIAVGIYEVIVERILRPAFKSVGIEL